MHQKLIDTHAEENLVQYLCWMCSVILSKNQKSDKHAQHICTLGVMPKNWHGLLVWKYPHMYRIFQIFLAVGILDRFVFLLSIELYFTSKLVSIVYRCVWFYKYIAKKKNVDFHPRKVFHPTEYKCQKEKKNSFFCYLFIFLIFWLGVWHPIICWVGKKIQENWNDSSVTLGNSFFVVHYTCEWTSAKAAN